MQGLWVLIRTPRLQEAQGARKGHHSKDESKLHILILGDSAAAGVGVAQQNQALSGNIIQRIIPHLSVSWELNAWSGCNTPQMLKHIQQMPKSKMDVIVISLGVNDVISTTSARLQSRKPTMASRFAPARCTSHRPVIICTSNLTARCGFRWISRSNTRGLRFTCSFEVLRTFMVIALWGSY